MDKRPLLWIDILGFGKDIENQSLEVTINEYSNLINRYLGRYSGVEFDIISDSLLFWAKSPKSKWQELSNVFQAAHLYSGSSFFYDSQAHSLIRGAIVIDEFVIDHRNHEHKFNVTIGNERVEEWIDRMSYHRLLGRAIVKAHKWESIQDWCLISLDPSYNQLVSQPDVFPAYLLDKNYVIKYPIPTKKGSFDGYVVNPFMKEYCVGYQKLLPGINDSGRLPIVGNLVEVGKVYEKSLDFHLKKSEDESVTLKLQNTKEFYRYVVENELYIIGNESP
ncbi:MAG: hypothetical protein WC810_25865 [Janthinobacterium sp.]|jgi:hypothetical protein